MVDELGRTPLDIEAAFGADAGWDFEGGVLPDEMEAQRAAEMEGLESFGAEESISEALGMSMEEMRAEAAQEAVLFAAAPVEELSLEGVRMRASRTGRDRVQVVSDMETPELGLPESQFELPVEEVRAERAARPTIERRAVNRHTEIFRAYDTFSRLAAEARMS